MVASSARRSSLPHRHSKTLLHQAAVAETSKHLASDGTELLFREDLPQLNGVLVAPALPGKVRIVHLEEDKTPPGLLVRTTFSIFRFLNVNLKQAKKQPKFPKSLKRGLTNDNFSFSVQQVVPSGRRVRIGR